MEQDLTVSEQNMRPLKICLELLLGDLNVGETPKPIRKGCAIILIALFSQFVVDGVAVLWF